MSKKKTATKPAPTVAPEQTPELPKHEPYAAELCAALPKEIRKALRAHITWFGGVISGLRMGNKTGLELFEGRMEALIKLRDVLDKVEKDSGITTYEMEVHFAATEWNAAAGWNATTAAAIKKAGA